MIKFKLVGIANQQKVNYHKMGKLEVKELLDAGVHFGHLTRKWNPNMAPYIYMERNGIHIINLKNKLKV